MARLTYKQRKRLRSTTFAIPSQRKYPIPDIAHARNALARVEQYGTPAEKRQVRRAVYAKFPSLRPKAKKKKRRRTARRKTTTRRRRTTKRGTTRRRATRRRSRR